MKKSAVTITTLLNCEQVINVIFYASLFTATVKWDTFLAAVFL